MFKSNTIQYKDTYRFLYTLVFKHIPNSVIIVENNIDSVIEYLKNSPLKHLVYYEFNTDAKTDKRKNGVLKPKNKDTIIYGIGTNTKTRKLYFDLLFEYVHSYPELLNVEEMVEEIESLEYKTAERIESTASKHDDVVMSYLLGLYVLNYGNNRARFGLFYSDAVNGGSITESLTAYADKDIFTHSSKVNPLSMNPFFTQLMYKPETLDDIEKKLARSLRQIKTDDDDDEGGVVVFDGTKDELGMHQMASDAFEVLNSVRKIKNSDNDELDQLLYGDQDNTIFSDLDKDPSQSWW